MAAFATPDDLAARLGIELDSGEEARAALLLDDASNLVREATGQFIELVEDDVIVIPGNDRNTLRLPERPILGVTSILADGTPMSVDDWFVNAGGDLQIVGGAFDVPGWDGTWFGPLSLLEITYSHGYENPALAKAVTLESVVRAWANPISASSQGIGGASFQFPAVGLMITADETNQLRRKYSPGGEFRTIQLG